MRKGESARGPRLVVGIGASAGGLEAFKQLLPLLPADAGMTFLLVQHLDPTHESLLTELLKPTTRMPVTEAEQGAELRPDAIYVIRPDTALGVRDGRIELSAPQLHRGLRLPVDYLFRSLAREYGPRAAGIVLSGAGSDGSAGLRELQAAGGLTLAQDPSTGSQSGMPRSAIDTGAVDLVLAIADMPAALARFDSLPTSARTSVVPPHEAAEEVASDSAARAGSAQLDKEVLQRLAALLEANHDFDLRVYKSGTVGRRVWRRMTLAGFDSVDPYLDHLRENRREQAALLRDLLISVTDFFRDEAAFDALRSAVVDPLIAGAKSGETLRVWVPGCATGEEAYSIGIEFLDAIEASSKRLALQIFATDIDEEALTTARSGIYSAPLAEKLSQDRLERHFKLLEGRGYQVRSPLRETVSFAAHDLTRNPPFSRMHLVSCRNVLIYLRNEAQERILRTLHFALQPEGYLFLGTSETTGRQRSLFATLSKRWRIFRKVGTSRPPLMTDQRPRQQGDAAATRAPGRLVAPAGDARIGLGEVTRRAVLEARVPPTIVVAENGEVLFMHGELRPFLHFPDGEPRFEISSLVTPELTTRARAALYKCRRDQETVVALSSPDAEHPARIRITASPAPDVGDGAVILSFEEVTEGGELMAQRVSDSPADEAIIEQLESELNATREDLRNTVEELESANEELRSSNEEAMSMNEELQSANEELEATTEELRSLNEELITVNAQLRDKVEQLEVAHDDLNNFFASTKIATLFLDSRLCIKRFTPAAEELVRIDHGDLGRQVGDIARDLLQNDLVAEAEEVLEHLVPKSRELETEEGRWIARRVLPYRTENRRIEGVVVTLVDVTDLKRASQQLSIRESQQTTIARLGLRALEDPELQSFFDQATREIQQTLGTDMCKILELQPDGVTLLVRAGVGWTAGAVGHATVANDVTSQAGFTLSVQEPVIVEDVETERRFDPPPLLIDHDVVSGISCTINGVEEPYGVLGAHTLARTTFTRQDTDFLLAVAAVIGGAVNRRMVHTRTALEKAAARAIAETTSFSEAVQKFLGDAVSELGEGFGELWEPTADGDLRRTAVYATPPFTHQQVVEKFSPGQLGFDEGEVGGVFADGRARWISSAGPVERFVRVEKAKRLGLRGGLAFPLTAGKEVAAVIAIFTRSPVVADGVLLGSLESIGRTFGDFLRRLDVEQRFRSTVDAAPVGIAELSFDGRWLRVNDRLCAIVGYNRQELLSRRLADLNHPQDDAEEAVLLEELRAGKRERYSLEKRLRREDGSAVWVGVSAAAVRRASDMAGYCAYVVEDISTRKLAEQELRASEERFRRILISSPVPMMVAAEDGEVVALSDSWSELTGYTHEQLATVDDWLRLAYGPQRLDEIRRLGEGAWSDAPQTRSYELEISAADGRELTVAFTTVTLGRGPLGRRLRLVAAVDLTRQRGFERELVEASRQKDEFIAMLGHELRNPLAAVRSATELLKQPDPPQELLGRVQAILERQTLHMAKLLDGLLDVSRVVQGKIELTRHVLDLRSAISDALTDHGERPASDGLEIVAELPDQPVWTEVDPVRLAQIVDNLLSNAIKYTPSPGRVTVRLERDDGHAVLTVGDTGHGIEPELLPHLFEPFRQGTQKLDRAQGGLGIGLALVKRLVDLHGGRVEARSEGSGEGSEFEVRLPLTRKRPPREEEGDGHANVRSRVLVIEDNEDVAEMLRNLLEHRGHEVEVALDGSSGIEMARQLNPSVVICDLGLPGGISGYEVAETLRDDFDSREISLIAISGYARPEDKQRCLEVGFAAHLTKPVSLAELEQTLHDLSA